MEKALEVESEEEEMKEEGMEEDEEMYVDEEQEDVLRLKIMKGQEKIMKSKWNIIQKEEEVWSVQCRKIEGKKGIRGKNSKYEEVKE